MKTIRTIVNTSHILLCSVVFVFATASVGAVDDDVCSISLRSVSDYVLVAHLGILDEERRQLIWKGTLKGDIEGVELWWFDVSLLRSEVKPDYRVDFYSGRWEIYDEDPFPDAGPNPNAKLLLAGMSAGQTLIPLDPPGSDGIWDGIGIVTEANEEFEPLIGCEVFEGGPVVFTSPFSAYGVGKTRIDCYFDDDEDDEEDD